MYPEKKLIVFLDTTQRLSVPLRYEQQGFNNNWRCYLVSTPPYVLTASLLVRTCVLIAAQFTWE
jgi:hypothetical protein